MHARMRHQARAASAVLLSTVLVAACAGGAGGRGEASRPAPRALTENGAHAVSTVTREEFESMRVGRIEELLMGRVPGLVVMRTPNGGYSLRIRGRTSFYGNDEPLIVIDGMPIRQGGASNALMSLDPGDVARVDVLKDAGSTAVYGVQGGNGVVLITTRRGR
jgi:TonB-dependent SusC/RagA subfamily outer membrane receptor